MDVIISYRLMPAVKVAGATISIEPTGRCQGFAEQPVWRWAIDLPDGSEHTGEDLCGHGNAGEMLSSMLSFLEAAAEAYDYHGGMMEDSATNLFPESVCEWASQNSEEIVLLMINE